MLLAIYRFQTEAEDAAGRRRADHRQQTVRAVAQVQRHKRDHLRRDDVRRLPGRIEGFVPSE